LNKSKKMQKYCTPFITLFLHHIFLEMIKQEKHAFSNILEFIDILTHIHYLNLPKLKKMYEVQELRCISSKVMNKVEAHINKVYK